MLLFQCVYTLRTSVKYLLLFGLILNNDFGHIGYSSTIVGPNRPFWAIDGYCGDNFAIDMAIWLLSDQLSWATFWSRYLVALFASWLSRPLHLPRDV